MAVRDCASRLNGPARSAPTLAPKPSNLYCLLFTTFTALCLEVGFALLSSIKRGHLPAA